MLAVPGVIQPLPVLQPQDPELLRSILDHLQDGVYFVDRTRRITYWNSGAERITGYSAREVLGHVCADNILCHVDSAGCELCQAACPLSSAMRHDRVEEASVFLRHRNGHRLPVRVRVAALHDGGGQVVGAVESFSDGTPLMATERRLEALQRATLTDPLTGVGNRRLLDIQIAAALGGVSAGISCGALCADIDHFKAVNDTWGHGVGDQVLRVLGQTLAGNVRAGDTVVRTGGEEFVVLLPGLDEDQLVRKAELLRLLVASSSVAAGDSTLRVTVSIGATLARPNDSAAGWMERADRALYRAKQRGRNQVMVDRLFVSTARRGPIGPRLSTPKPPTGMSHAV